MTQSIWRFTCDGVVASGQPFDPDGVPLAEVSPDGALDLLVVRTEG